MNSVEGKKAVIIGATGDIGSALTSIFAEAGMSVLAAGRDVKKLSKLSLKNPSIRTISADCSVWQQVQDLIRKAHEYLDGIDILVTSVGTWHQINRDTNLDQFAAQLDVDLNSMLKAAMIPIFQFNQHFSSHGGGFIVDISSWAAEVILPGNLTYSPTKSAVRTFIEQLRSENSYDSGVVISRIIPQLVDTPKNREAFPDIPTEDWRGAVQIPDIANWIMDNIDNLRAPREKKFESKIVI